MEKLWDNFERDDEAYTPQTAMRHIQKPRLRDRIFNWFCRVEAVEEKYEESYEESFVEEYAQEPYENIAPQTRTMPRNKPKVLLEAGQLVEIQQALRDWKASAAYFQSVTEPALIDYAVYEMEAAQKRYMYLLCSARNMDMRDIQP